MKKGRELNITPIKPTVHYTNKQIEDVLYEINDELYFFRDLYINDKAKKYLMEKIVDAGNRLKNISITRDSKQLERRKEILEELRKIYKSVNSYDNAIVDEYKQTKSMSGYFVAVYLKQKEEGLTDEEKLKWIKKLKKFQKFYCPTESLVSVQRELLQYFEI